MNIENLAATKAAAAPTLTNKSFVDLELSPTLLRAIDEVGYVTPSPIQAMTIPYVLKGMDVLGCAQTGTGKTAAFALPILQQLEIKQSAPTPKSTKVLVLAPTRELAAQIGENFREYAKYVDVPGGIRGAVIFGGVGHEPQARKLHAGVHILIATPGRLLDLIQQGALTLSHLEILVFDEADRMLDMGFIHDIKKVLKLVPAKRQTLFFSATMPREIRGLAEKILTNPVEVAVNPVAQTADKIEQGVYMVTRDRKRTLLNHLLADETVVERALVFSRTKHGANRIAEQLEKANIPSAAIHGNKSQSARERALSQFKSGEIRILVATDIAARGIDVDGVSHVVNFDLPNEPESYVHRIGRTARAGASGIAWSLCDREEESLLRAIERTIGKKVPVLAVPDLPPATREMMYDNKPSADENRAFGSRNGGRPQQQARGSNGGPGRSFGSDRQGSGRQGSDGQGSDHQGSDRRGSGQMNPQSPMAQSRRPGGAVNRSKPTRNNSR